MTAEERRARKYGLTTAQLRALLKLKKGCWICGKTRRKDGHRLALYVDHDHISDRVRGVLCYRHNKYLVGRHRDGRWLRAAADYVDSTFDAREIAA